MLRVHTPSALACVLVPGRKLCSKEWDTGTALIGVLNGRQRKPIVDSSWNLAKSAQQTFSHSSNHRQSGLHCETLSAANAWLLMGMCGNKQAEPD